MNRIRFFAEIASRTFDDEGVHTNTSAEQINVENNILTTFKIFEQQASIDPHLPRIKRSTHINFLKESILHLPKGYVFLEASRPWLIYWILHALWTLNDMPDRQVLDGIVKFLAQCQHESGGYGGGPMQLPHLGATYAAVNSLCIIGTKEAYNSINLKSLETFLWSLRNEDGSFDLHKHGEQDIRGVYCALSIAKLTNTYTDALFDKSAEWIMSCQTYEGGFAGCPGMEAHGGYTYCAVASLALLKKCCLIDINALLRWCVNRQMSLEGGFQGRTNKLVDGCYSFWQGATFPVISVILAQDKKDLVETVLFNQAALQEYVIICCQCYEGGLVDKPGKPRDMYHTCYTLSGLSVAQYATGVGNPSVIGTPRNRMNTVHPLHNIEPSRVRKAIQHFSSPPQVQDNN